SSSPRCTMRRAPDVPAASVDNQRDGVRRIGPIGTWTRAVLGGGLVVDGSLGTLRPSGIAWYELVIGLIALPLLMVVLAAAVGHYRPSPLRLTGPLGTGINCLVIVGLAANHITGPTVELFYGATLILAAWRALPGCEATVISNWVLHRDDQIGCPLFSPVDRAEQHHRQSTQRPDPRPATRGAPTGSGGRDPGGSSQAGAE
ncbi:MAG: hypothetical protein ACRDQ1_20350, partial [Sciscionella sp.]